MNKFTVSSNIKLGKLTKLSIMHYRLCEQKKCKEKCMVNIPNIEVDNIVKNDHIQLSASRNSKEE